VCLKLGSSSHLTHSFQRPLRQQYASLGTNHVSSRNALLDFALVVRLLLDTSHTVLKLDFFFSKPGFSTPSNDCPNIPATHQTVLSAEQQTGRLASLQHTVASFRQVERRGGLEHLLKRPQLCHSHDILFTNCLCWCSSSRQTCISTGPRSDTSAMLEQVLLGSPHEVPG
jgi:hypothetical protein